MQCVASFRLQVTYTERNAFSRRIRSPLALEYGTVLVDISINHESGGGAKISVCSRRATNANEWRMYPTVEDAKKVLLAFGVRDDLMQGLNRPMDALFDLNSREPIDFLSVEVPEDVLTKHGFKLVG